MIPGAYPSVWESDVVLGDGRTAHVRPIRPDDAQRLVTFHARLSPEARYYRFFSAKPRLTDTEVKHFTVVDYVHRFALVFTVDDDIIGVGRYEGVAGSPAAEVAFTVLDNQHGRGVATMLLEQLAEAARNNGLRTFTASTLADNRSMLAVFRRAGYVVKTSMDSGVVDLSFDLDPTPEAQLKMMEREARADANSVAALLRPGAVTVVSSANDNGLGNLIAAMAVEHGAAIPIHQLTLGEVLPEDVDLTIITVAYEEVAAAIDACIAARSRVLLITATGFDPTEQAELVAHVRGHGVRVVGPSSLGVVSNAPTVRLHATVAHVAPGSVALSSQSGPLALALVRRAQELGMGFSSVVMIGDKADISGNDLLQHWELDPDTHVVLMYVESFGNPAKFARVARRVSATKPIVALWSGTGPGDDATIDGLFRQAGVLRATSSEQLLDSGRTLAAQPLPNGRRIGIVTDSGSVAVLAQRAATVAGLDVVEVVDIEPPVTAAMFGVAAAALADRCDALLAIHLPVMNGDPEGVCQAMVDGAPGLPKLAVLSQASPHPRVTVFEFPEPAIRSLAHLVEAGERRRRVSGTVPILDGIDMMAIRKRADDMAHAQTEARAVEWPEAAQLLRLAGIHVADGRVVTDVEAAVEAAREVGWPVVIKALGLTRLLPAELGGVAIDLVDVEDVRGAYIRMAAALGEGMNQALVQRQVLPGVAVIVRLGYDPVFGPVIGLGPGGASANRGMGVSRSILPLTDVDAERLISEARINTVVSARQTPDEVRVLTDLLHRVSALADAMPGLSDLGLNPVLLSSSDAAVTWATGYLGAPQPTQRRLRRLIGPPTS